MYLSFGVSGLLKGSTEDEDRADVGVLLPSLKALGLAELVGMISLIGLDFNLLPLPVAD